MHTFPVSARPFLLGSFSCPRYTAMYYPYEGSLDIPVWKIALPLGDYALAASGDRGEGPVVFTSRAAALRYLKYHEREWGAIQGGVVLPAGRTLREAVEAQGEIVREEENARTLWIDLREPFGFHGALDAEYIAFPLGQGLAA